jgi:hypothetical protein
MQTEAPLLKQFGDTRQVEIILWNDLPHNTILLNSAEPASKLLHLGCNVGPLLPAFLSLAIARRAVRSASIPAANLCRVLLAIILCDKGEP